MRRPAPFCGGPCDEMDWVGYKVSFEISLYK
jgi:hypothetical protein